MKYTQRNFMVPIPHAASFEALNARLAELCRERQRDRAGRHAETIGERLAADLAALRPMPDGLFEACEKKPAKVSSTGLVRYRMNDYSVPTRFAFQHVLVKGFVDEVAIVAGSEVIALHGASTGATSSCSTPSITLALLEQKPGALDEAAPLQSWTLPEGFQRIRRLLESRMGNRGKKEFIQILRLLEVFDEATVAAAVEDAMRKTHIALALGLAACQRGFPVAFVTAAGLVHQLQEARDERRLLRLQQSRRQAPHHRRARLPAPLPDRGGAPVRGVQPTP